MKLNAESEQKFTEWEGKVTPPRPPERGFLGGSDSLSRARVPIATGRESLLGS